MSQKDWQGNNHAYIATMGARGTNRETNDYYATEPKAVSLLLEVEVFKPKIWECACGQGHLSIRMAEHGYSVYSTDLIDRGFGDGVIDFIVDDATNVFDMDIVTNPPYRHASEFICKAMEILPIDGKLALFLPIRYLEGKSRKPLFKQYPPIRVYISSSRLMCAKNGDFKAVEGSAMAYAWFVWIKGFTGNPTLMWIN